MLTKEYCKGVANVVIAVAFVFLSGGEVNAKERMKDFGDAGIYCESSDSNIGNFYRYVEKTCKNKYKCYVKATAVATRKELKQHRCTGFFVAPVCKGEPANLETRSIFGKLAVFCPK
ncbi:hypothetical protein A9K65_013815 [Mesorhizobium sp. WSM1497]|uniref:hypothetical protein n=1 Tax=Mesorhizobium sp. WSM1497 TaxID=278153 RepID=UPI000A2927E0|nr:hypothetical protein [Mesorhizobium sp. WSM1497]ARP64338.1 hypothetical protein A9K65_013815 [Mesorhizobium sp. WSM1497]